ncbi:MAG: uroporphyrinogen decarboxylase, partial [Capnocytophaga granulosa]
ITTQPVDIVGVDAAILFSDILVVPQAMGIEIEMKEQVGPFLPHPIRSEADIERVEIPDVSHALGYVMDGIRLTKERLAGSVPLIGFAGAPWTIFCYAVEGKGSKNFDVAKSFAFSHPEWAHSLLQKITDTTIAYLKEKVKAGVDALQLFDSWGGVLSPEDYRLYSWRYTQQIVEALSEQVPVIVFAKGCWYALQEMSQSKAAALGIDWSCSPAVARQLTAGKKVLQGNLDPAWLLSSPELIKEKTWQMIRSFGKEHYIANLGHGILPHVPVAHAQAFVEAVKTFKE